MMCTHSVVFVNRKPDRTNLFALSNDFVVWKIVTSVSLFSNSMSKPSGSSIQLTSLRAENLPPEDGKTCDPYVEIKLGEKKFKTHKIEKNHINPQWDQLESIKIPWDGRSEMPQIEFTVMDHDTFSRDDFLGFARLQLHPSMLGKEMKVALQIRNEGDAAMLKEHQTLGNIYFTVNSDAQVASSQSPQRQVTEPSPMGTRQPTSASDDYRRQGTTTIPGGAGQAENVTIKFVALRGTNLAPVDGTTCDPFVQVTINGKSWKTEKVSKNCKNPVWTKLGEFTFPWDGKSELPQCTFEVVDDNMVFSDEHIGYAKAQLHPSMLGTEAFVNLGAGSKTKQALIDKHGSLGSIHFQLESESPLLQQAAGGNNRGRPAPPGARPGPTYGGGQLVASPNKSRGLDSAPTTNPNQAPLSGAPAGLQLTILNATDLLPRDIGQGVDAFVVIRGEKEDGTIVNLARTTVQRGSLHPVWNEKFNLVVDPTVTTILLHVVDLDDGGSTDFLGECALPFEPQSKSSGRQELVLRPRDNNRDDIAALREFKAQDFGMITVEWNNAGESASSANRAGRKAIQSRGARAGRSQASPSLQLTVLSVTNLPNVCDPYVRVKYGDEMYQNPEEAAKSTVMAVWNFSSNFLLEPGRSSHDIRIEVRSEDRLIGTAIATVSGDASKQKTAVLPLQCGGGICGEVTIVTVVKMPNLASGATNISAADLNDSTMAFTVVSAAGLGSGNSTVQAPYLIVEVSGPSNELEYTSPSVRSTPNPMWYFQLPDIQLDPNDVITIGIWDEDGFGFDRSLGQAKIEAARFLRAPFNAELQLEDREAKSNEYPLGKVQVEWSFTPKRRGGAISSPHIVEVLVQEAQNLASSMNPTAVVRIACDDQPGGEMTTKTVPKSNPKWDECLQMRVDSLRHRLRLSVWDSDSRNAEFLGECYYELSSQSGGDSSGPGQSVQLNLRPRQDAHFYSDDIALMNRFATALGSLSIAVKTYSVREHENQVRERLRKRGASYTLTLMISDSAEIQTKATYFVRVIAGGEEQLSHTETSSHPRFRKTFEFALQYDTEMVTLYLVKRTGRGDDEVIGDVTFPVSPPERVGVEPVTTWVTLKPPQSVSGTSPTDAVQPVKLLTRWRTTRKPGSSGEGPGYSLSSPQQAGGRGTAYAAQEMYTPARTPTGEHEEVSALRNELSALRQEVTMLRSSGGDLGHSRSGGNSPSRYRAGGTFTLNVYSPQHNRISTFFGDSSSTVADVLTQAARELGISQPEYHAIVFRGSSLPVQRCVQEHVASGETVFIVPRDSIEGSRHHAPAVPSPHRGGPTYNAGTTSRGVLERIRLYGPETAIVTAIATVPYAVQTPSTASLIQMCVSRQLNGFTRMGYGSSTSELLLQGPPSKVSDALADILAQVPTALVEEVHGYIPILGLGFRVASNAAEGERMFELCSLPFQQGSERQSWFYHAGDDSTGGRAGQGIRYIDERG